ncbi:MAG: PD-(D/E)XK nuclease family protein [Thermodesulfobacteriota bacterium]
MKITFDMAFDQGCWPGPLTDRKAAAGELWVGPLGLLNLIETMTGLRGPGIPGAVRVASLVPAIRQTSRFWSQSAVVDPFGTAAKILDWRDFLFLHGWQGEKGHGRLPALAEVTAAVLPGIPDRLRQAAGTISGQNNAISELHLFEPPADLPRTWQQVITALTQTGTTVAIQGILPATPKGDLAACRKTAFSPTGDGSLQLLRPLTPGAAAQEAAAWLSGLSNLDRTVIIGPDNTLDAALYRFGLPTTGGGIPVYDNALLQILPLVLEMAWSPPDPQRALELLMLPVSPIPRGIAFRLIRALQNYPAVESEEWRRALDTGLQEIPDTSRLKNLKNRLEAIFNPCIRDKQYPVTEVHTRIDLLRNWARGRMQHDPAEGLDWQPLIAQLENAGRMVSLSGLGHFTAPQIRRMIHDITVESHVLPLYPDQAGLAHVDAPECLVDRAENILWWSFNRDSAGSVFTDPFSDDERRSLRDIGVVLPDPGRQAIRNAVRWQRPLLLAEKQLILVCPKNSLANEEQFPHPLWDELVGRLKNSANAAALETRDILSPKKPALKKRKRIPLPGPESELHIDPTLIIRPESESPDSLSDLFSCPFRWLVTRLGRISSGLSAALSSPEELEGWFIHEILRRLLEQGKQAPTAAAKKAGSIFDQQGPFLAAKFFLPGHDDLRARVKSNTETAAAQIFRLMDRVGFSIDAVEQKYEQKAPSLKITLNGRPDLVLGTPQAVIDFKRGGVKYRQTELANGTSIQLAVYGHLLRGKESAPFPPAAYFMLKTGQLITTEPRAFPEAIAVNGIELKETWQAVKTTYKAVREELDRGEVGIPGNQEEPPKESQIIDGRLSLKPCAFCNLGALCGQAFMEAE